MMNNQEVKIPTLYTAIANSAKAVKDKSHRKYGRLWDAFLLMGGVLSALVEQGTENPLEVSESASQRMPVASGLLQSSVVVEQVISGGFYWAASALLRQHMEALARVIHIRNGGSAVDKRVPNVNVLPFGLQINYGRLSELYHLTKGELLGDFATGPGGEEIADIFPRYDETWARVLLPIHIAHLVTLAREVNFLHMELYPSRELIDINQSFLEVANILVNEGFWPEMTAEG